MDIKDDGGWDLVDKKAMENEQMESIINLMKTIMKLEQDLSTCKFNNKVSRKLDLDIKFKDLYIHIQKDSEPMYSKVFKEITRTCSFATIKSALLMNLFLFKKF